MKFLRLIPFSVFRLLHFSKKKGAVLITDHKIGAKAILNLKREPGLDVQIKTVIVVDRPDQTLKKSLPEIRIQNNLDELPLVLDVDNTSLIILCLSRPNSRILHFIIKVCKNKNVHIKELIIKRKKISMTSDHSDVFSRQNKRDSISQLQQIHPEKLLYQKPISLDNFSMKSMIQKKVILITGAGGSIGSELSRQISKYKPDLLIFYEITELFLHNLEIEFKTEYPNIKFISVLGDVRNDQKAEEVIRTYRPNVIFHAAAYKHVPMLENNPMAAIENNIKSTWQLANLSIKYTVNRFVFISTDKAVNPVNIMGTSKRVCELICQYLQMKSDTVKFLAVRFGNVLGSAGSVVQTFKEQIERGGPVTITHPDIKRYFMSISESCQLVMQAGAIGNGGEIFILDMEEPVKILELAENMITLAGYIPNKDIEISFTGLRAGEKLYEELLTDAEASMATTYPGVRIAKISNVPFNLDHQLKTLFELESNSDLYTVKSVLKNLVPELNERTTENTVKGKLRVLKK